VQRSSGSTSPARVYHRLASTTQTAADAAMQEASGEIWGRAPRDSDIPKVKAYPGPLPPGAKGVEFTTDVEPDRGSRPSLPAWSGPRAGVIVEGDFAKIRVTIIKNMQGG
jgi:hypothetical protein